MTDPGPIWFAPPLDIFYRSDALQTIWVILTFRLGNCLCEWSIDARYVLHGSKFGFSLIIGRCKPNSLAYGPLPDSPTAVSITSLYTPISNFGSRASLVTWWKDEVAWSTFRSSYVDTCGTFTGETWPSFFTWDKDFFFRLDVGSAMNRQEWACLCAYLFDFHIHLVLDFTFSHLFSNPATRLSSSIWCLIFRVCTRYPSAGLLGRIDWGRSWEYH